MYLPKLRIHILSCTTQHHPGAGLTVFMATSQPCPKSRHPLRSAGPMGLQIGFSFLFRGRQTGEELPSVRHHILTKIKIRILSYTTYHHSRAGRTVFTATSQPYTKSRHRLRSTGPVSSRIDFFIYFPGPTDRGRATVCPAPYTYQN